jgi:hypothetical protein
MNYHQQQNTQAYTYETGILDCKPRDWRYTDESKNCQTIYVDAYLNVWRHFTSQLYLQSMILSTH